MRSSLYLNSNSSLKGETFVPRSSFFIQQLGQAKSLQLSNCSCLLFLNFIYCTKFFRKFSCTLPSPVTTYPGFNLSITTLPKYHYFIMVYFNLSPSAFFTFSYNSYNLLFTQQNDSSKVRVELGHSLLRSACSDNSEGLT